MELKTVFKTCLNVNKEGEEHAHLKNTPVASKENSKSGLFTEVKISSRISSWNFPYKILFNIFNFNNFT